MLTPTEYEQKQYTIERFEVREYYDLGPLPSKKAGRYSWSFWIFGTQNIGRVRGWFCTRSSEPLIWKEKKGAQHA